MLQCDSCDRGWHMACLDPPMTAVPRGSSPRISPLASADALIPCRQVDMSDMSPRSRVLHQLELDPAPSKTHRPPCPRSSDPRLCSSTPQTTSRDRRRRGRHDRRTAGEEKTREGQGAGTR